ncbi:Predicted phosphohydrolase, Cof family, HAD superfamily [Seinonella peptonophila]|uniref:Predicted phosphohydrolase, Cof family, HAD superfamily n=1 Tax=Seinonella peptonophila TaxID=112248 RepID=A0A1M4SVP3_9BACL|nr:hypothetical protein [Seinonella peptonophila]SHE36239.1 Predicted phosphohydrolase, Cof family, HAD superfamily [Seinonella peptonophila]
MDEVWKKVLEFHQLFSVPHATKPTMLTTERAKVRMEWIQEELGEMIEAQTLDEQADAMIDTIYLALGTLVEMGVKPEKLFEIVHEANMSKCWKDGKPRYRESDGKVIKPPTWIDPAPRLKDEIKRQQNDTIESKDCK